MHFPRNRFARAFSVGTLLLALSPCIVAATPLDTSVTTFSVATAPAASADSPQYDILSFMAPPAGSLFPVRVLSGCIGGGRGCGPQKLRTPVYLSDSNPGGISQYSNTFYLLKDDADPGQGGWTTYEKYGYDEKYIYIMRDADWGGPGPAYSMAELARARFDSSQVVNGNDYVGTFSQNTSMADVSGNCRGCFFNVPAGTVSTGYWAARYMSVGAYVDAGFPNHNVPNLITAFDRNRRDGTWQYVPGASFNWPTVVQLYDHGTADFGGDVGTREYIVMRRFLDAVHDGCPPPGCPYIDERYWYAKDVGLVRFEVYDYGSSTPDPQVTWAKAGSREEVTDFAGPVWDVSSIYTTPPTAPIDPGYDHVYVNMASQVSSRHAQLFFSTQKENYFSEDKSISIDINNDGIAHTYDFNFSGNIKWKGKITGLRLDPVDKPGDAGWYKSCGCLSWQRIRIGTETKSGYAVRYDIKADGDTEGFTTRGMDLFSYVSMNGSWGWRLRPIQADPSLTKLRLTIPVGR